MLRAENAELRDRVAHLEAELGRNSENSSKPPSADPVAPRQSRAERRAQVRSTKRPPGKQPGAPGATLGRREPDEVIGHEPARCRGCGADLTEAEVVGEVRRQVIDLPPIRPHVVDHVAKRRRCSCGVETTAEMPKEARAPVCWGPEVRALAVYLMDRQHLPVERTAELLSEVVGAPVSTGWLCQVHLEAAERLEPFISEIKSRLEDEPVLHADETSTRVGLKKAWVHTLCTKLLTLLVVHPTRGLTAILDTGVLLDYHGNLVHDGLSVYDILTNPTHAQCGAHLVRHLASVAETPEFAPWCEEMTAILLKAKRASEAAQGAGRQAVPKVDAAAIRSRYQAILDDAFALLPPGPPPRRRHEGGWTIKQREAWNLATRLRNQADQVLRLLSDTRVPFTNNCAESSFRMVKLHDRISGTFRSEESAAAFATVRSYVQTAAQNGQNRLAALHQLFTTGPWLPPYPAGGT